MIRLGGGTREPEKAALSSKCDVCQRQARGLPRPVARPPLAREFDEIVPANVFMIPDLGAKEWPCFVMVNLATGFTVATVLRGCEPLETGIQSGVGSIGQFLIMWACPLGQLPVDLGSRFR